MIRWYSRYLDFRRNLLWKFGQIFLDTIECLCVIWILSEDLLNSLLRALKTIKRDKTIGSSLLRLIWQIRFAQSTSCNKRVQGISKNQAHQNTILPLEHRWVYILHFAPGRWSVTGLHGDRKHGWGDALRSHVLRLQSIRLGGQGQQLHAVVWLPERRWASKGCIEMDEILFLWCLPDLQRYLKTTKVRFDNHHRIIYIYNIYIVLI